MEPLKPSVKTGILAANPQASPEEIDEYEMLLAQRFVNDPDYPMEPLAQPGAESADPTSGKVENRLRELHIKLFGIDRSGLGALTREELMAQLSQAAPLTGNKV